MIKRESILMICLSLCFGFMGCDDEDQPEPEPVDAGAPYIYLYPEEAQEVAVTLVPTKGAWLMESEPLYGDGWTVWAETSGRLDDQYDFLFYSARVSWDFQMEFGWAVGSDEIFSWFDNILPTLGLSQRETDDFLEYWTTHLPYSPCYLIYPQYNETVDQQVEIVIDPEPDSILRLWLAIDRVDSCTTITEPEPVVFKRTGFTVIEWGVVMRRPINSP